jgi:Outer membrane protein beta-barrel domain
MSAASKPVGRNPLPPERRLAVKLPLLASCIALAACAASSIPSGPPASGEYRSSRIDLYFGGRSLDEDDWSPVEDQPVIGVEFVHEGHDAPIGFELALFASEKSKDDVAAGPATVDVTGKTGEIAAGVRKTFLKDDRLFHPYLGGGLAAIQAKFHGEGSNGVTASDDDTSGALYVHGGVDFDLGPAFVIGLDLRLLFGSDVTLFGVDGDADYGQVALLIGFRF